MLPKVPRASEKSIFVYFKWPRLLSRNAVNILPVTAAEPENYNCTQQNLPFKNEIVPRRFRHGVRANLRLSPAGNIPTISLFFFFTHLVFLPGFPAPEARDCDISATTGWAVRCVIAVDILKEAPHMHEWHAHTDRYCTAQIKKKRSWHSAPREPHGQGEKQTKQSHPENGRNVIPYYFPLALKLCLLLFWLKLTVILNLFPFSYRPDGGVNVNYNHS